MHYDDFIPKNYDRDEAIIDMNWAMNLNWWNDHKRAWRILTKVVNFIVIEGDDGGPKPVIPNNYDDTVEVSVVVPQQKRYRSNVFIQSPAKEEGKKTTYGFC